MIARSFARIHETNLKKQGLLPLTFADPADYEKVRENDRVSILGVTSLAPAKDLNVILKHEDGTKDRVTCRHSMTARQIEYFRAGSSVNLMGARS